jgi:type I restriction enzyme S subunit
MNKLWPKVRLGEVLRLDLDRVPVEGVKSYPMVGVLSFGRGLFDREPIENGRTSYRVFYRLKAQHVVMSQLFGWEGALALSSEKFAGKFLSPQFPTFLCDDSKLDREFLGWLMRRPVLWEDLGSRASGMGDRRRTLTPDALFKCEIPLPPLAEQRRVVARIEELAANIREAHTLCQKAAEQIKALVACRVAYLFEHGPAKGWISGKLGDYVVDACYGTSEKTTHDAAGVPILRMGNIQNGQLETNDLKYLHLSERDRAKLLLKRGDILVNRTNSADLVGKCAVFDLDGDFSFASYLIRLRLDQKRAEPRLISSFINSPAGRAYMLSEKRQMTGQANVNATKLKALPIALPPLSEQRRIVAELDALQAEVDALKRLQGETAAELVALLLAILDRAFKGEL